MLPHSATRVARSEDRLVLEVEAKVFGLDGAGRPFYRAVSTVDISRNGVRVQGLPHWESPGEVIGVRRDLQKARFRVIWVGKEGTPQEQQVGLFCLEQGKQIWELDLTTQKLTPDVAPGPNGPRLGCRRQALRCRVTGKAQVRELGGALWRWSILCNLGAGGCYMETPNPLAVGARVETTVTVAGSQLHIMGRVVSCDPQVGMGIQFIQLSSWRLQQLQELMTSFSQFVRLSNQGAAKRFRRRTRNRFQIWQGEVGVCEAV